MLDPLHPKSRKEVRSTPYRDITLRTADAMHMYEGCRAKVLCTVRFSMGLNVSSNRSTKSV